jgi:hypothetical protein
MSRISAPLRGRKSSKGFDLDGLAMLMRDNRMWCKLGKVFAPDGAKCWQVNAEGMILVEVETIPDGLDLTCRLATWGSGGGFGGWSIPRPNSIVAVMVPDGEIEFFPIIIAVLDCNAAPDGVGDDLTLIADDRDIAIQAPNTYVGDKDATEHAVLGDAQKDALDTFSTALNTYASAIQTTADPSGVATTTLSAAITVFQTQLMTCLSGHVRIGP